MGNRNGANWCASQGESPRPRHTMGEREELTEGRVDSFSLEAVAKKMKSKTPTDTIPTSQPMKGRGTAGGGGWGLAKDCFQPEATGLLGGWGNRHTSFKT